MKNQKLVLAFVLLALSADFLGAQQPPETYKIGDIGPAGGIVFYDKGSVSDGWRYLEAAPAREEFSAEWGLYEYDLAGTATAVGSGRENTKLIVEYLNARRERNRAAQKCAALNINGYTDWFLPSKDELNLMHTNIRMHLRGGFKVAEDRINWTHIYWSSSQRSANLSWYQSFSDGYQVNSSYKSDTFSVRAVRVF
ncbi:MAG: DUF1566 domain-containing protein [Treponema sp.]|nr:DUF1566 domain-containing protein [Treponema sp.]